MVAFHTWHYSYLGFYHFSRLYYWYAQYMLVAFQESIDIFSCFSFSSSITCFCGFPESLKLSEYMHLRCLIRGFILDLIRICIRIAMQITIVWIFYHGTSMCTLLYITILLYVLVLCICATIIITDHNDSKSRLKILQDLWTGINSVHIALSQIFEVLWKQADT